MGEMFLYFLYSLDDMIRKRKESVGNAFLTFTKVNLPLSSKARALISVETAPHDVVM